MKQIKGEGSTSGTVATADRQGWKFMERNFPQHQSGHYRVNEEVEEVSIKGNCCSLFINSKMLCCFSVTIVYLHWSTCMKKELAHQLRISQ